MKLRKPEAKALLLVGLLTLLLLSLFSLTVRQSYTVWKENLSPAPIYKSGYSFFAYANSEAFNRLITIELGIFTLIAGFAVAYITIMGYQRGLKVREEDVRLQRARRADEIADKMYRDEYASNAMRMLESYARLYKIPGADKEIFISKRRVVEALERMHNLRTSLSEQYQVDRFIYDCFDHLFSIAKELESNLKLELILWEDVIYPFDYYSPLIYEYRDWFEHYLSLHFPRECLDFLKRFRPWRDKVVIPHTVSQAGRCAVSAFSGPT